LALFSKSQNDLKLIWISNLGYGAQRARLGPKLGKENN